MDSNADLLKKIITVTETAPRSIKETYQRHTPVLSVVATALTHDADSHMGQLMFKNPHATTALHTTHQLLSQEAGALQRNVERARQRDNAVEPPEGAERLSQVSGAIDAYGELCRQLAIDSPPLLPVAYARSENSGHAAG